MNDFEMYPVEMTVLAVIPLLLSLIVVTVTIAGILPVHEPTEEGEE